MDDMAAQTHSNAAPGVPEVRLSRAVIDSLDDLPKSKARAVAKAIEYLRSGEEPGQRLKFSLPGADGENYYAIRTSAEPGAPVMIYRRLLESEGGGYLVTALVADKDFEGYERADQKGLLDTTFGKYVMGVAAVVGSIGARGVNRRL